MKDCFSSMHIENVNGFLLVYKATDFTRVNANAHKLHTYTLTYIQMNLVFTLAFYELCSTTLSMTKYDLIFN